MFQRLLTLSELNSAGIFHNGSGYDLSTQDQSIPVQGLNLLGGSAFPQWGAGDQYLIDEGSGYYEPYRRDDNLLINSFSSWRTTGSLQQIAGGDNQLLVVEYNGMHWTTSSNQMYDLWITGQEMIDAGGTLSGSHNTQVWSFTGIGPWVIQGQDIANPFTVSRVYVDGYQFVEWTEGTFNVQPINYPVGSRTEDIDSGTYQNRTAQWSGTAVAPHWSLQEGSNEVKKMGLGSTQVKLYGSSVSSLHDYMEQYDAMRMDPVFDLTVPAGANTVEVTSLFNTADVVSIGLSAIVHGSIMAESRTAPANATDSSLANSVDPETTKYTNGVLVSANDSNDPILDSDGRVVNALLHGTMTNGQTVADGALYITFFVIDDSLSPVAAILNADSDTDIKLGYTKASKVSQRPAVRVVSSNLPEIIKGSGAFRSTVEFSGNANIVEPANAIITFSGTTATTEAGNTLVKDSDSEVNWQEPNFGADAAEFKARLDLQIIFNGELLQLGNQVTYESANQLRFTYPIYESDWFTISWR